MKAVISGGPGTGKSTLLKKLGEQGFHTIPEAARAIIKEEEMKASTIPGYQSVVPWNPDNGVFAQFERLVVARSLQNEADLYHGRVTFLDRSLVDPAAYCENRGISFVDEVLPAVRHAKYGPVFLLEPRNENRMSLGEMTAAYLNDRERREPEREALRLHDKLVEMYHRFGCDVVMVPDLGPDGRADFVLRVVKDTKQGEKEGNELEGKFRVDHAAVKNRLENFLVDTQPTYRERNFLRDAADVFSGMQGYVRVRENVGSPSSFEWTIKGKNKSNDGSFVRAEQNLPLTEQGYNLFMRMMPETPTYEKDRTILQPIGDQSVTIFLDDVVGLGEFVEVEAPTQRQVYAWRDRLQLGEFVKDSYYDMVKKMRGV